MGPTSPWTHFVGSCSLGITGTLSFCPFSLMLGHRIKLAPFHRCSILSPTCGQRPHLQTFSPTTSHSLPFPPPAHLPPLHHLHAH